MTGTADERRREELGNEIAGLLGPLVRDLRRALVGCAADAELAPSEAQALWLLEVRDSTTTKDVARALDIDPANASTLVTRLEDRGLVRRQVDARDQRRRLVTLTKEGAALRRRLAICVSKRRPTFRALSTNELATFRDLLRRAAEGPDR